MPMSNMMADAAARSWQHLVSALRRHSVAAPVTIGALFVTAPVVIYAATRGDLVASASLVPALVVVLSTGVCWLRGTPAPWPRWLVTLSVSIAALGAVEFLFGQRGHAGSALLASLTLMRMLLPGVIQAILRGLTRMPLIGQALSRRLSEATLYVGLLGLWLPVNFIIILGRPTTYAAFLAALIVTIALGLAVWRRRSLWHEPIESFTNSTLPHVPAWLCGVASLIGIGYFAESPVFIRSIPFGVLVSLVIAVGYSASRSLQRSPVEFLPDRRTDRSDSIQSKVEHYVDVHDLSRRLVASVERSDAGVFGITGVRGAGKSALTRHALSTLARRHFVLEIAAPVRHDMDMGFFTSVCRAVCGKVMEDLEPILRAAPSGVARQLWAKFRAPATLILGACAALPLYAMAIQHSKPVAVTGSSIDSLFAKVRDPLLGDTIRLTALPVEAERRITDHLLRQIESIVVTDKTSPPASESRQAYILVPASGSPARFLMLRLSPNSDPKAAIAAYRSSLNERDTLADWRKRVIESVWSERFFFGRQWEESEAKALTTAKSLIPLGHLTQELVYHLHSSKNDSPPKPASFASTLALEAFMKDDPRLAFDTPRLNQFREVLQVYRRFLDGDVVPAVRAAPAIESAGVTTFATLLDFSRPVAVLFWTSVAGIVIVVFGGLFWQMLSDLARAIMNRRYLDLYAEAEEFLEQLAYKSNREMSAGLSWQGISFGGKRTLSARDLTLPGLTARYTRFLAKVCAAYNGKALIAIDELDKVHDPEHVRALLTEIKGALFVRGTFYFISISEDAARSFRRRLAAGRDIFESTFDDVIEVLQMDVPAAVAMLQKLENAGAEGERLSPLTLEVAALFGGGIPREIIRARRTLSISMRDSEPATPSWAAQILLREALDHWAGHLGETNLSGDNTIKVRHLARAATQGVAGGPAGKMTYSAAWDNFVECVSIIDPNGLRHSVGYTEEHANSGDGDSGAQPQRAYQRVRSDLQAVLRLLILVHLTELIRRPDEPSAGYEAPILECHRALADKPALAETLLLEMRAERLQKWELAILVGDAPREDVAKPHNGGGLAVVVDLAQARGDMA